jgi:hypothetical protein
MTLMGLFAVTLANLGKIAVGWLVAFWPVTLVVALLSVLVYWILELGDSFIQTCEIIGGSIEVLAALFDNLIILVVNSVYVTFNTVDNIITGVVNKAIDGINLLIEQLNRLPGVAIPALSQFEGLIKDGLEIEYRSLGDAWEKGKSIGNEIGTANKKTLDSLANLTQGVFDKLTAPSTGIDVDSFQFDDFLVNGALPVTNESSGDALKTSFDKEDIKYIKDLAERDYIAKYQTTALAPNISIQFGDVHENADMNQLKGRLEQILKEEIAVVAEG